MIRQLISHLSPLRISISLIHLPTKVSEHQKYFSYFLKTQPIEHQFALENYSTPIQQLQFLLGRSVIRHDLTLLNPSISTLNPLLKNKFGAILLPNEFIGSLSHKDSSIVTALTSQVNSDIISLGIDLECCQRSNENHEKFMTRILTSKEISKLGELTPLGISPKEELMLLFSLKESVYKALHPFYRRFISFHEVEIDLFTDGTASIHLSSSLSPSLSQIIHPQFKNRNNHTESFTRDGNSERERMEGKENDKFQHEKRLFGIWNKLLLPLPPSLSSSVSDPFADTSLFLSPHSLNPFLSSTHPSHSSSFPLPLLHSSETNTLEGSTNSKEYWLTLVSII